MLQHPLVRPRGDVVVHPTRGTSRVLRTGPLVNAWLADPPSVDDLRPTHCPACGAPSRVVGEPWTLHGHGLRARQVRGPEGQSQRPYERVVRVRRFRCCRCRAVVTVVPADVLPRKHYSATAIALAIALLGVLRYSFAAVRRAVSTWFTVGPSARGWPSLLRWIDDAVERALWGDIRAGPADASRHAHAHRIAMSLAGHAPHGTGGSLVHQACVGATRCE